MKNIIHVSKVSNEILFLVDGEAAARMIKSTNNINRNTPIIAVTAYEHTLQLAGIFDDTLNKPVTKEVVTQCIQRLSSDHSLGNSSLFMNQGLWSIPSSGTAPSTFSSTSNQQQTSATNHTPSSHITLTH